MVLKDVARQERLAQPRGGRHRRPDRPVPHDDERVALEEPVRDRSQPVQVGCRDRDVLLRLLESGHERARERGRREIPQPVIHVGAPAEAAPEISENRVAVFLDGEHLRQKSLRVEHLVGHEPEHLLKPPVLLARAGAVEDVVEEQLLHHRGDHAVDFRARQVDQDGGQLADFGGDSEHG